MRRPKHLVDSKLETRRLNASRETNKTAHAKNLKFDNMKKSI
jgi:hypothetical protein